MSYTRQRRIRRPFQEPEPLPDPIDGAVGDARAAGAQGYTSVARDISGNVESAVNTQGQRVAFSGGLSPEQSATAQIRAGGATAAAPPASRVGGTVTLGTSPSAASVALNRPTAASVALDHPTGAATALDHPTGASVALNRPTNASVALAQAPTPGSAPRTILGATRQPAPAAAPATAAPAGAPRDFRSFGSQPVVIAGSAADSAAAVGQSNRAFQGFNPPTGFVGKVGQVAAAGDPYADAASHVGTTAVPGGDGKPGFVTTGAVNPDGPADGGTGISVGGVAQIKRPDGVFAAANSAQPGVPPALASRDTLASTGTYGGALKNVDAGPTIRAPLAPVTSAPATGAPSPVAASTASPARQAGTAALNAVEGAGQSFLGMLTSARDRVREKAGAGASAVSDFAGGLTGHPDASQATNAPSAAVKSTDDYMASNPSARARATDPAATPTAPARMAGGYDLNVMTGAGSDVPRTILGAVRQSAPAAASTPPVPLTTLPAVSPVPAPRALTLGLAPDEIERRRKAASGALAAAM